MQIRVKSEDFSDLDADVLLIGVTSDFSPDAVSSEHYYRYLAENNILTKDFSGKSGETALFYLTAYEKIKRIMLVGLGTQGSVLEVGKSIGEALRQLRKLKYQKLAVVIDSFKLGQTPAETACKLVELVIIGNYQYEKYRKPEGGSLKVLTLVADFEAINDIKKAAWKGQIIGQAVNFARDLQNHPGNWLTPKRLAQAAQGLSKELHFSCQVFDKKQIAELKMGALLGVAQGSAEEPRFIVLEYRCGKPDARPIVLVGKGITFDTGGISIKRSSDMDEMKFDMSGAAAVLGAFKAVAELELPINLIGLIPAAENMPGASAVKPGDILTSASGITIEVLNTDAEGRLILADALSYARKFQPAAVIDLATLTGACFVALGVHASGLLGNDKVLLDQLTQAGESCGERVWQLPLFEEHYEDIEGDYANIKNSSGSGASVSTAGAFLGTFAKDYKWAHLDIAGTASTSSSKGLFEKGGTGVGVRLLIEFLEQRIST